MSEVKRLNYFNSQFLVEKDFQDEQSYHVEMRKRHNQAMHSWGVAQGLEVTKKDNKILVSSGVAIDKDGREIVLPSDPPPESIDLTTLGINAKVILAIAYEEYRDQADSYQAATVSNYTRITERPKVIIFGSSENKTVSEKLEFKTDTAPENGSVIRLAEIIIDGTGNIASINTNIRTFAGAAIAPGTVTLDKLAPAVRPIVSIDGVSSPGGNVDLVSNNTITITPDDSKKQITIGETHSARIDNPHSTTAAQVGALVSVDGVSNSGGNVDLIAANTITINPNNNNKQITIGESHSARIDNPHSTTAAQVGALPIAGGTMSGSIGFTNATVPMLYVFQSGGANPERPIISHSPAYPTWGLSYRDVDDKMIFQSNGTPVMTVNLNSQNVGVGTVDPDRKAKLDIEGHALLGYEGDLSNFGAPLKSGFYQSGDPKTIGNVPDGSHSWTHLITARHSNRGNNHQLQIASAYTTNDRLFFRKIQADLVTDNPPWNEVATRGTNTFTGNQTISGNLSFGTQTRQMIDLWNNEYGIGVQSGTLYFRTHYYFAWHRGGSHDGRVQNPGSGARLMALNDAGDLILSARTNPSADPNGSSCRAFVDFGRKLIINFDGDFSQGVEIFNGRFTSTREVKENITDLNTKEAIEALNHLNPVKFKYKTEQEGNLHLGFIAEDVPSLLASPDHKSIGSLDVVAVLTKVLQEQQKTISELAEKVKVLEQQNEGKLNN